MIIVYSLDLDYGIKKIASFFTTQSHSVNIDYPHLSYVFANSIFTGLFLNRNGVIQQATTDIVIKQEDNAIISTQYSIVLFKGHVMQHCIWDAAIHYMHTHTMFITLLAMAALGGLITKVPGNGGEDYNQIVSNLYNLIKQTSTSAIYQWILQKGTVSVPLTTTVGSGGNNPWEKLLPDSSKTTAFLRLIRELVRLLTDIRASLTEVLGIINNLIDGITLGVNG